MKNLSFMKRLNFALSGIRSAWRSEASLRTHIWLTVPLLAVLLILQPTIIWWALCGVMVSLVIAAELINTAFEHLTDHLHPEQHPRIKIVKDCAAAAVLILSIGALWVAAMLIIATL